MKTLPVNIPRLVIAGASGNVGKTTVTVALAAAFRRRGLRVVCFKCGPDFLDPTYHRRATGIASHNLDGWMMGRDAVCHTLGRVAEGADLVLIEGMMGLFDGLSPKSEVGSTAQLAKWLGAKVLLVVDSSAMARSLGALALGFQSYDPELEIGGLLCNFIGGASHLKLLRQCRPSLPVLGGLPRTQNHRFTERHLGLEAAKKENLSRSDLSFWADMAEKNIDLTRILDLAKQVSALNVDELTPSNPLGNGGRLGIAQDDAFSFYYEDNLRRLELQGLTLVPFSPMQDQDLPEVDGLYFGGGYPELHAARLSENHHLRKAITQFAGKGFPVYGECGGFMYLSESIDLVDGSSFPMVGLLPGKTIMSDQLQSIGYVEVTTTHPTLLGPAGTRFRGHQFRYSSYYPPSDSCVEKVFGLHHRQIRTTTEEGFSAGSVLGTYVHGHWASNPQIPAAIAASCRRAKTGRHP